MIYFLSTFEYCASMLVPRGIPCAVIAVTNPSGPGSEEIIVFTRELDSIIPPERVTFVTASIDEWRDLSVSEMCSQLHIMQEWSSGILRLFECGCCEADELVDVARSKLNTQDVIKILG